MLFAVMFALHATVPPMSGHSMVFDQSTKSLLMLGGRDSGPMLVWTWTGAGWSSLPSHGLQFRSLAAVGSLPGVGVMLHGGSENDGGEWVHQGSSLTYRNGTWTPVGSPGPSPRDHHQMACSPEWKSCVLFGGGLAAVSGRSDFYGDTWVFSNGKWTQYAGPGPSPRVHYAMAYDSDRKRMVMAGGYGPNGAVDDRTWEWDGSKWSAKAGGGPATFASLRMAYHSGIKRIVAFGGGRGMDFQSTTWTWDGTRWARLAVSGPTARGVHAMAYDPIKKVIVMYGGATQTEELSDTWLFDGAAWKPL